MNQGTFYQEAALLAGKVKEAERLRQSNLYDEALDILKGILANHSSENYDTGLINSMIESRIAAITSEKAERLCRQGKYHKSRVAHEEALATSQYSMSEKQQLVVRNNAALNLLEQGQYEQSGKMFREIVRDSTRLYGPDHRSTIGAQANLARVLDRQVKFKESLALYKEVMRKTKNLGPDESITWIARMNMGVVLMKVDKPEEALKLFKEVLDMRTRTAGPDDPETLMAQNNLAKALLATGNIAEALETFKHVADKRKVILGPVHPHTLVSQCYMAQVLATCGEHLAALKIYNQVVERQGATIGNDHPDTKGTRTLIEKLRARVGHRRFAELQEQCANNDDALLELHKLIHSGDKGAVKDLLERGVDITKKTAEKGNTTLHIAVNKNDTEIVEILLKHAKEHLDLEKFNEYINAKTTSKVGNTALHIAACNGCLGPMRALLRSGATYNMRNKKGETPHEQTKHESAKSLLGLLGQMFEAAKQNTETFIGSLANLGKEEKSVMMGAKNESGQTLGQIVAACKDRSLLREFLKLV